MFEVRWGELYHKHFDINISQENNRFFLFNDSLRQLCEVNKLQDIYVYDTEYFRKMALYDEACNCHLKVSVWHFKIFLAFIESKDYKWLRLDAFKVIHVVRLVLSATTFACNDFSQFKHFFMAK